MSCCQNRLGLHACTCVDGMVQCPLSTRDRVRMSTVEIDPGSFGPVVSCPRLAVCHAFINGQ